MAKRHVQRPRDALRARINGFALPALFVSGLLITDTWMRFNQILVWTLGIPLVDTPTGAWNLKRYMGILPLPAPWWVGGIVAFGYVALLVSSWRREHQVDRSASGLLLLFKFTPGLLSAAAVFSALGCNLMVEMYSNTDHSYLWNLNTVVCGVVAVIAFVRSRMQAQEDKVALEKSRRRRRPKKVIAPPAA